MRTIKEVLSDLRKYTILETADGPVVEHILTTEKARQCLRAYALEIVERCRVSSLGCLSSEVFGRRLGRAFEAVKEEIER